MKRIALAAVFLVLSLFSLAEVEAAQNYIYPLPLIMEYIEKGYIDFQESMEAQKIYDKLNKSPGIIWYECSEKSVSATKEEILLNVKGLVKKETGLNLKKMNEIYMIYKEDGSFFDEGQLGTPRANHPWLIYGYPPEITQFLEDAKKNKKGNYIIPQIRLILNELNYWLWYYSPQNPDAELPISRNFMGSMSERTIEAFNYCIEVFGCNIYAFPDLASKGTSYYYDNTNLLKKSGGEWTINALQNTTVNIFDVNEIKSQSIGMVKDLIFGNYKKGAAFNISVQFPRITTSVTERVQLPGGRYGDKEFEVGDIMTYDESLLQKISKNSVAWFYVGNESKYDEAALKIEQLFDLLIEELQEQCNNGFNQANDEQFLKFLVSTPRIYNPPSSSVLDKKEKMKSKRKKGQNDDYSDSKDNSGDEDTASGAGKEVKSKECPSVASKPPADEPVQTGVNKGTSGKGNGSNGQETKITGKGKGTDGNDTKTTGKGNGSGGNETKTTGKGKGADGNETKTTGKGKGSGEEIPGTGDNETGNEGEKKGDKQATDEQEGTPTPRVSTPEKTKAIKGPDWIEDFHQYRKWDRPYLENLKGEMLFTLLNIDLAVDLVGTEKNVYVSEYYSKKKGTTINYDCKKQDRKSTLENVIPSLFDLYECINYSARVFIQSCSFYGLNFELSMAREKSDKETRYYRYSGSFSKDYKYIQSLNVDYVSVKKTVYTKEFTRTNAELQDIPLNEIPNYKLKRLNAYPAWTLTSNSPMGMKDIPDWNKQETQRKIIKKVDYYKYIEDTSYNHQNYTEIWQEVNKDQTYLATLSIGLLAWKDKSISRSGLNGKDANMPTGQEYEARFAGEAAKCGTKETFPPDPEPKGSGSGSIVIINNGKKDKKDDSPTKSIVCDTLFNDDYADKSKLSRDKYDGNRTIDNSQMFVIDGEWKTKDSRMQCESGGNSESLVLTGDIEWREYSFSGDFRFETDDAYNFGIVFFAQKEKTNSTRYVLIHSLIKGNVELWEIDGNDKAQKLREDAYNFKKGTIYKFSLHLANNEVIYQIDNKNVLNWKETLELTKGRAGLRVAGKGTVTFDNLLIRKCYYK